MPGRRGRNGGPSIWIYTTGGADELWLHWSSTESSISTPINPAPAAWLQFHGSGNTGQPTTDCTSSAANRGVRLIRRVVPDAARRQDQRQSAHRAAKVLGEVTVG
jgi:hypothetical protein